MHSRKPDGGGPSVGRVTQRMMTPISLPPSYRPLPSLRPRLGPPILPWLAVRATSLASSMATGPAAAMELVGAAARADAQLARGPPRALDSRWSTAGGRRRRRRRARGGAAGRRSRSFSGVKRRSLQTRFEIVDPCQPGQRDRRRPPAGVAIMLTPTNRPPPSEALKRGLLMRETAIC